MRGSASDGQRHAENGIGAEARLVGRAVEIDQGLIETALVERFKTGDGFEDFTVHGIDRLADALAAVALHVAVTQLGGFVRAGGGARRHSRAAERAVIEGDIDFNRGVATGVEDFAGDDVDNFGHGESCYVKRL